MESIPCDAGDYQSNTLQDSCSNCDTGYYCPYTWDVTADLVTLNTQKQDCPAGHECTSGSLDAATPCSAGTYQDVSTTDGSACKQCDAGFFCPFEATVNPIACPDFHLCELGASTPEMCLDGQICRTSDITTQQTRTDCPEGYFCRRGKET